MAVLRIPTYLLWILIAVIVILIVFFAFVKLHKTTVTSVTSVPSSIQYSLEYFNAAEQNTTLLVPSQYYQAAKGFSINGNSVVENNTLYYSILFNNTPVPKGYNILLDMGNISMLPGVVPFSYNFTTGNISSSLKGCLIASSKTDAFFVCDVYANVSLNISNKIVNTPVKVGLGTFAIFPNNSTIVELNSTIVYNGENSSYIPSVRLNSTAFLNGDIFLYQNTTAFYLSTAALGTFYGREMFLPNSTIKNVIDNFYSVRIVS